MELKIISQDKQPQPSDLVMLHGLEIKHQDVVTYEQLQAYLAQSDNNGKFMLCESVCNLPTVPKFWHKWHFVAICDITGKPIFDYFQLAKEAASTANTGNCVKMAREQRNQRVSSSFDVAPDTWQQLKALIKWFVLRDQRQATVSF